MTTIVLKYCPKNLDDILNNEIINDHVIKNKLYEICPGCNIKHISGADELIEEYDEKSIANLYYDSPFLKTNFIKNKNIDFYRVIIICNEKKIALKLHYIIYPRTINENSRFIKYYTNLNLLWTIYFKSLIRIMVNPINTYELIISYILNLIKTILGDIHLLSFVIVIGSLIALIIFIYLYKHRDIIIKFLQKYIKICTLYYKK